MAHVPRYSFRGVSRLARDAGVAKSAVSRLLRGKGQPSYLVVLRIADALSRAMGRPVDLRELAVDEGSHFPTAYPCDLFGCRCLPEWAFDGSGALKEEFRGVVPGKWTLNGGQEHVEAA
jgi:transcriptional regulator with XRE-family HTH domain